MGWLLEGWNRMFPQLRVQERARRKGGKVSRRDNCVERLVRRPLAIEPLERRELLTSVSLSASASSILEGSGSYITLTATRDNTTGDLTVPFTTSGTATSGTDYTALGSSFTILAGNTSASLNFTPIDDTAVEGNENTYVTLTADINYTIPPMQGSVGLTITDDDCSVAVSSSGTPSETGPANGTFTLTRTGYTGSTINVGYTMSGTATNGTDYTTLSGTATMSAGNSTATVTLATTDDADYEGMQSAILGVNSGTGYNVGSPSSATLYITDNDSPPTVTVTGSGSPSEAGATGTITVTRTGSTTDPLVVNVSTLGGTATNGTDFSTIGSTITIGAGQSSATATVTPTDDANVEPTESIFFAAVSGTGYNVGSPSSVTLYIADNDYVTVTRPQTSIPGWLAVC